VNFLTNSPAHERTIEEMAPATFRVLQGQARDADSDVALVEALRRGEPQAELAAWNRFATGVDQTLRRMLGPGPDREDLLQEVFIRFYRRIGTLREPSAVRGFLTGICIHVVHAEISRRQRRRWLSLTVTGDLPEPLPTSPDLEGREAVTRYYRMIDKLGAKDRSYFVARTIEGMTLDEVAAAHEVSVSTAQRRINRATKRVAALVRRDPMLAQFAAKQAQARERDEEQA
jgi:RNA polymerase sigma-70 factor (ECF subfamily)